MLALFDTGDEILLPDPCYPCNRQILASLGVTPRGLATDAAHRFQPTAAALARAWGPRTRGVMLATPANPTGTSIEPAELQAVLDLVRQRHGALLVDEIYLGLSFDPRYRQTALAGVTLRAHPARFKTSPTRRRPPQAPRTWGQAPLPWRLSGSPAQRLPRVPPAGPRPDPRVGSGARRTWPRPAPRL